MVFNPNTESKTEFTIWKNIKNWAENWCQIVYGILFDLIYSVTSSDLQIRWPSFSNKCTLDVNLELNIMWLLKSTQIFCISTPVSIIAAKAITKGFQVILKTCLQFVVPLPENFWVFDDLVRRFALNLLGDVVDFVTTILLVQSNELVEVTLGPIRETLKNKMYMRWKSHVCLVWWEWGNKTIESMYRINI